MQLNLDYSCYYHYVVTCSSISFDYYYYYYCNFNFNFSFSSMFKHVTNVKKKIEGEVVIKLGLPNSKGNRSMLLIFQIIF